MIKLVEIFQGPVVFNDSLNKTVETYELREILINPKYIILATEAVGLQNKAKHEDAALVPGLHRDAPYTQLLIHCPSHTTAMYITIVGNLDYVNEKITAR